jgi:threonine/homoserine/homoserine lactone efflux protein
MTLAALLLFASVYLVAVASPGPGLAAVVARGLGQGTRSGVAFVAGFVVGDLVWFTVAATGLSVIAASFETLFLAIKYAGCAYLLYLAYKIWTAPAAAMDVQADAAPVSHWGSFFGALSLTLGNPKVMVFFISLMPLVVDLQSITPLVFAELAVVIVLVITPVMATALIAADRARRLFRSQAAMRRMNQATAGLMGATAVAIAART